MVISSSSHVLTYDEVARALPSSNLVVSAKFAPLSQSDAPLSCLPPILSQDSIQAFYKGYDVDPRTVSLEQYYLDLSLTLGAVKEVRFHITAFYNHE